jgi:DNA-binding HxlR family transcriptional regulator
VTVAASHYPGLVRSYGQYCALARALDVVGDRWTLLVIRELSHGPQRYSELQAGLPGIATNLLAERLRSLEDHGLVDRSDDGYRLTERGQDLAPTLRALVRWGAPLMRSGQGDDEFRSRWLGTALPALLEGTTLRDPVILDLVVEGTTTRLVIGPDGPQVGPVDPEPAVATLAGPADAVLGVLSGALAPADAVSVSLTGDPAALDDLLAAAAAR